MADGARAAAAAAEALRRGLASPAFGAALGDDDDERVWLLLRALCEELHPLGPCAWPSAQGLARRLGRAERDARLRADFDGRNHRALARREGLSVRQVRRIVDRRRRRGRDW